jgi:Reverse transcriptase (RNA-dependent DNA polymerase)/Endonuclease/Exonuclease/phosphatase family
VSQIDINGLKISLWNVQELSKGEKLVYSCKEDDISIATETWLKPDSVAPTLPGYTCFHNNRNYMSAGARRGSGGVAIYVSQHIQQYVSLWRTNKTGSIIWIKISKCLGFDTDVFIAGCYFPPEHSTFYNSNSRQDRSDPDMLFQELTDDIAEVSALGLPLVAGDFNARTGNLAEADLNVDFDNISRLLGLSETPDSDDFTTQGDIIRCNSDSSKNPFGKKLIDLCSVTSLRILNGRLQGDTKGAFTCYTKGHEGCSAVDYFLAPASEFHLFRELQVVHNLDSDHSILRLYLKTVRNNPAAIPSVPIAQTFVYKRSSKIKDLYISRFEDTDTVQLINEAMEYSTGVDRAAELLNSSILLAVSTCYKKSNPLAKNTFPHNGWFDIDCKNMRSRFKQAIHNKDTHLSKQILKMYKCLTKRKKREFNRARAAKLVDLAKNNPSRFWKMYKVKKSGSPITDKLQWKTSFERLLNIPIVPPGDNGVAHSDLLGLDGGEGVEVEGLLDSDRGVLNRVITAGEVEIGIAAMKRNKSSDLGGIRAEYIIDAIDQLKVPIANIFQKVFTSQVYPKIWSQGMICPIFKSGDPNDCGNYRGITIGSILGKLYATVLEKRISKWAEDSGIRARGQAGFRKDHRTVDNIFILRTLIEKASKAGKKHLHVCFVDFQKAFDTVPRDLLWRRLAEIGVNGTMLKALISMYKEVSACVKTPSGVTDFFPCTLGVKQGCPLSPSLFGLYIDRLEKILLDNIGTCDAPTVNNNPVPILLYADDIALISESRQGLQNSLNLLGSFCETQLLTVNLKKTQVVIFNDTYTAKKRSQEAFYSYAGQNLEIVEKYTYLGLIFERNGKWTAAKTRLLNATKKALFAMQQRSSDIGITTPKLKCSLFDSLVAPVMSYGCEIWGVQHLIGHYEEAEMLHRSFLRRLIHVRKNVPNEVLLAELGRFPLGFEWQKLILRFFNRLVELPQDRLLKQAFLESVLLNLPWSEFVHKWADLRIGPAPSWDVYLKVSNAVQLSCIRGLGGNAVPRSGNENMLAGAPSTEHPQILQRGPSLEGGAARGGMVYHLSPGCHAVGWPRILDEGEFRHFTMNDFYSWLHNIDISVKPKAKEHFFMYRCKTDGYFDVGPAGYLLSPSAQLRNTIARFRSSSHDLEVEKGRWKPKDMRIPRDARLCQCCSLQLVEDEMHFLFDCQLYYKVRGEFYRELFQVDDRNMRTFFSDDNFHAAGTFIGKCMELRQAHLAAHQQDESHSV